MARGAELGLIPRAAAERVEEKRRAVETALEELRNVWRDGKNALTRLRRPGVKLEDLEDMVPGVAALPPEVREQIEIEGKYSGYIERQKRDVERMRRWERKRLPPDFDYATLGAMRREAREKLCAVRPRSVAQARRIAGVRPADIAVLLVHMKGKGVLGDDRNQEDI